MGGGFHGHGGFSFFLVVVGQFNGDVTGHGVLHQLVGRISGFDDELVDLGLPPGAAVPTFRGAGGYN